MTSQKDTDITAKAQPQVTQNKVANSPALTEHNHNHSVCESPDCPKKMWNRKKKITASSCANNIKCDAKLILPRANEAGPSLSQAGSSEEDVVAHKSGGAASATDWTEEDEDERDRAVLEVLWKGKSVIRLSTASWKTLKWILARTFCLGVIAILFLSFRRYFENHEEKPVRLLSADSIETLFDHSPGGRPHSREESSDMKPSSFISGENQAAKVFTQKEYGPVGIIFSINLLQMQQVLKGTQLRASSKLSKMYILKTSLHRPQK